MMEIKIKLFDAKEELPKRSGEYLCFIGGTYWTNMPYSTKHKRFNAYDDYSRPRHAIDVLFWAELPELYKEREDESKETEVKKDIEWAIKEIEGLETETSENYPHNKMIEKDIVLGILNKLDEPQTNSQIDPSASELKNLREAYNKLSDVALNDRQSKNKFYEMWRKADERAEQYGGLLHTIYKTIHAKKAELKAEWDYRRPE